MKIGIHQPNYLPWLGYFYKIRQSDVFVILDNVEYQTGNANSITNRSRIKTANGEQWLTVPVKKSESKLIMDIPMDLQQNWKIKHIRSIQMAYSKSPFFKEFFPMIENWLNFESQSLSEFNTHLILKACELFEIKTELRIASQLPLTNDDKNGRLIEICKLLGANIYLSGKGAQKYMDMALYENAGIAVEFSSFNHPEYKQLHGDFIPGLSFIDAIMNCGAEETRRLISGS